MQQEETDEAQLNSRDSVAHYATPQDANQAHVNSECMDHIHEETDMIDNAKVTTNNEALEVNGGIDDNDLLAMMANDAMPTYETTDTSQDAPLGEPQEK